MKNKMRKIYNEITLAWNEATQRYDKVLHEDSFMYDGPLMEMIAGSCLVEFDWCMRYEVWYSGGGGNTSHCCGLYGVSGEHANVETGCLEVMENDAASSFLADPTHANWDDMMAYAGGWTGRFSYLFWNVEEQTCPEVPNILCEHWGAFDEYGGSESDYLQWDNTYQTTEFHYHDFPHDSYLIRGKEHYYSWSSATAGSGVTLGRADDGHCPANFVVNWEFTGAINGCMDELATNFDPSATIDDGSCTYGGYSVFASVEYFGYPDNPDTLPKDLSFANTIEVDLVDNPMNLNPHAPTWPAFNVPSIEFLGWMTYFYDPQDESAAQNNPDYPWTTMYFNKHKLGLSWSNYNGEYFEYSSTSISKTGEFPYGGSGVYAYPDAIESGDDASQMLEITVAHPMDYIYSNDKACMDNVEFSNIWLGGEAHLGMHTGLGASTHPMSMDNTYINTTGTPRKGRGLVSGGTDSGGVNHLGAYEYNVGGSPLAILGRVSNIYGDADELLGTTWRASIKAYVPSKFNNDFCTNCVTGNTMGVVDCTSEADMDDFGGTYTVLCNDVYMSPKVDLVLYGGKYVGNEAVGGRILTNQLSRARYGLTNAIDTWSDDLAVSLTIPANPETAPDFIGFALEFPPFVEPVSGIEDVPLGPGSWRNSRNGQKYYFDRLNVQTIDIDVWPEAGQLGYNSSDQWIDSNQIINLNAGNTYDVDETTYPELADLGLDAFPLLACLDDGTNPDSSEETGNPYGCHTFEWIWKRCDLQAFTNYDSSTVAETDELYSGIDDSCKMLRNKLEGTFGLETDSLVNDAEVVLDRTKIFDYTSPDYRYLRAPILRMALRVVDYEDLMDYDLINLYSKGINHSPEITELSIRDASTNEEDFNFTDFDSEITISYSEDEKPIGIHLLYYIVDYDYPEVAAISWHTWGTDTAGATPGTGSNYWSLDENYVWSDHNTAFGSLKPTVEDPFPNTGIGKINWSADLLANCANITTAMQIQMAEEDESYTAQIGTCAYKYKIDFSAFDPAGSEVNSSVYLTIYSTDSPMAMDVTQYSSQLSPFSTYYQSNGFATTADKNSLSWASLSTPAADSSLTYLFYALDHESCPFGTTGTAYDAASQCYSCLYYGEADPSVAQGTEACLFYMNVDDTINTFDLNPTSGTGIVKFNNETGYFTDINNTGTMHPEIVVDFDTSKADVNWIVPSQGYCPNSTLSIDAVDDINLPNTADISISSYCPPAWATTNWGATIAVDEDASYNKTIQFYTRMDQDVSETYQDWLDDNIKVVIRGSETVGDIYESDLLYKLPIGVQTGGVDMFTNLTLMNPYDEDGSPAANPNVHLYNIEINHTVPRLYDYEYGESIPLEYNVTLCNMSLFPNQNDLSAFCPDGTPDDTTAYGSSCTDAFNDLLYCPPGCDPNSDALSTEYICATQQVNLTINGTSDADDPLEQQDFGAASYYSIYHGMDSDADGEGEWNRVALEIDTDADGVNDTFVLHANEQTLIRNIVIGVPTTNDEGQIYMGVVENNSSTHSVQVVDTNGNNVLIDNDENSPTNGKIPITCVDDSGGPEVGSFGNLFLCGGEDFNLSLVSPPVYVDDYPNEEYAQIREFTIHIYDNYWNCDNTNANPCGEGLTQGDHHYEQPIQVHVFDTNDPPVACPPAGNDSANPIILYEDAELIPIQLRCTDRDGDDMEFIIETLPDLGMLWTYGTNENLNEVSSAHFVVWNMNETQGGLANYPDSDTNSCAGGKTVTIYYTPQPDIYGNDEFNFYCTDDSGLENDASISATVYLKAVPINDAPIISITSS